MIARKTAIDQVDNQEREYTSPLLVVASMLVVPILALFEALRDWRIARCTACSTNGATATDAHGDTDREKAEKRDEDGT